VFERVGGRPNQDLVLGWWAMDQLMRRRASNHKRQGERGMTLVEVMLAGFILVVGMLGFAALMATSIAANARSRTDSTATMLTQSLMEQISASLIGNVNTPPQMKDCTGTQYPIDISAGGAAVLSASETIDWTQSSPPTGYQMFYEVCNSIAGNTANAQERIYDVRWRVTQVSSGPATDSHTWLIVAGARPKNYSSNLKRFTLPVEMKMYVTASSY
jgi:Tfp pilus assembly protein PilV